MHFNFVTLKCILKNCIVFVTVCDLFISPNLFNMRVKHGKHVQHNMCNVIYFCGIEFAPEKYFLFFKFFIFKQELLAFILKMRTFIVLDNRTVLHTAESLRCFDQLSWRLLAATATDGYFTVSVLILYTRPSCHLL